jgi:UDP-glucose 4-epimerase
MTKKILILGSLGFIGSAIKRMLIDNGYRVVCCDLDELKTKDNYFVFKDYSSFLLDLSNDQFDFIINAAGNGNVHNSIVNPRFDFDSNVILVHTILESLRQTQRGCCFIHFSSAAVYGEQEHLPISESNPLKPISPYGHNKMISEMLCRQYSLLYDIHCIVLRPFSVYGPGLKKQLIWDVFNKFNCMSGEGSIEFFGTGKESRDFIFIDDFCRILNLILINSNKFNNFEIFNLANGIEVEVNDIIEIISRYFPGSAYNFSGAKRIGDPIKWRADISKLNEIGYEPIVTIEKGIEYYHEWFNGLI